MKKIFLLPFLFMFAYSYSQVRIKMQKENNLYKVPCSVNGLNLKFIFDTGSSNVQISKETAIFMLNNGYLNDSDIIGTGRSRLANGSIVENTRIKLRTIEIGGLIFHNIEASASNQLNSSLLLGQSVIQKLGKMQIDGNDLLILNYKENFSAKELDSMKCLANMYYERKAYSAASEIYQKIHDVNKLDPVGTLNLANCYFLNLKFEESIKYFEELFSLINYEKFSTYDKFTIYCCCGESYYRCGNDEKALLCVEKSSPYVNRSYDKYFYYWCLARIYQRKEIYARAAKMYCSSMNNYAAYKQINLRKYIKMNSTNRDNLLDCLIVEGFGCDINCGKVNELNAIYELANSGSAYAKIWLKGWNIGKNILKSE